MKVGRIIVAISLLFAVSCSSNKKTTMNDSNSVLRLHDIWSLVSIGDGANDIGKSNLPNLEIFVEKKQILGFGGCNNYSGNIVEVNLNEISFGPIRSTKMACPQLSLEQQYFSALGQTQTYSLENLRLKFYDKKGKQLIEFKKVD